MTKQELAAVHLRAAMASLEAAWAALGLDDEAEEKDPETCDHSSREYLAMGVWKCKDCGHKEGC